MDDRDCLAHYPFVAPARGADRIGWRGSRRKFGPDRFSYDRGTSSCGVYLPDLEQPRLPDTPPPRVKLRLVKDT
jgi:hypothetical protein